MPMSPPRKLPLVVASRNHRERKREGGEFNCSCVSPRYFLLWCYVRVFLGWIGFFWDWMIGGLSIWGLGDDAAERSVLGFLGRCCLIVSRWFDNQT